MRVLEWERLLLEQRVPFIRSGPNVKRGEVNVRCPFCGSADPSHHMGINLETGWWSCWRNRSQHSGKSPLRLVMRLLGVPYGVARELCGLGDDYVDPEGFDAMAARLLNRGEDARPAQVERRFLDFDRGIEPITDKPRVRRFWNYLYSRGFDGRSAAGEDVDLLCRLYGLRCASSGYWNDRVILPYYQDGELVTWTGRAIGESTARYKDLSVRDSLVAAKETLFNHDAVLGGGRRLVIVEGPMDALKLDFYGHPWGVRAVGLSTNSVSEAQSFLLQAASGRFAEVAVMMDDADGLGAADGLRMQQQLSFLDAVTFVGVPFGAKDAGELRPAQVIQWARAL